MKSCLISYPVLSFLKEDKLFKILPFGRTC
jgi:hypothetical protein